MSDFDTNLSKQYAEKDFRLFDLQNTVCSIDDDFTLYDLFAMINKYEQVYPGICEAFGIANFHKFWDQINLPYEDDEKQKIEYLELYWTSDYEYVSEDSFELNPKLGTLNALMDFHGVGPQCSKHHGAVPEDHVCDEKCSFMGGWGIEFTPLNEIKHLPIRMNTIVEFWVPPKEDKKKFTAHDFKIERCPSLWCLITSIFFELTFAGYDPAKIQEKIQDLIQSCEQTKKDLKENGLPGTQNDK